MLTTSHMRWLLERDWIFGVLIAIDASKVKRFVTVSERAVFGNSR